MKELLQTIISAKSRRIISAWEMEEELKRQLGERQWEKKGGYKILAREIGALVGKGLLVPVKASGHNGRVPPLAARYRRIQKKVGPPPALFKFRSALDLSYYAGNLAGFEQQREILWAVDAYLVKTAGKEPEVWDTLNERSFQLTGDEKFLASPEGVALLRRIKIKLEDLHCYPVAEPFFYRQAGGFPGPVGHDEPVERSITGTAEPGECGVTGDPGEQGDSGVPNEHDEVGDPGECGVTGAPGEHAGAGDFGEHGAPVRALIIENKDTFETICRLQAKGLLRFSPPLHLIIYGEGNKITGSWPFLFKIEGIGTEPPVLYYFGDLDPEGIAIFCRLQRSIKNAFAEDPGRFAPGSEPRVIFAEKMYRLLLEQGRDRALSGAAASTANAAPANVVSNLDQTTADNITAQWNGDNNVRGTTADCSRGGDGREPVADRYGGEVTGTTGATPGVNRPACNFCAGSARNAALNLIETGCSPELAAKIKDLWSAGRMIPQEALSASYLGALGEVEIP